MAKKKTARFELRMTPIEKEKLIAKAAEAHLTVSQYLLRLSDEKKIVISDNIPGLVHEIRKIGVNINQSPERCVELLKEANICFFFAQKYHSSMKYPNK